MLEWYILLHMSGDLFVKVILSIMYLLCAINMLCVCRGHECWYSCDILHICHNSAYGVWCCERQAVLPDAIFLPPSLRLLYCKVRDDAT